MFDNILLKEMSKINQENYNKSRNWSYINYLDTGNLTENKINEVQYIDLKKDKLPSRARRIPKKNSILYSTVRPNQRHYGYINHNNIENLVVSTGFVVIDIDENIANSKFIYYYLTQKLIIDMLQNIGETSTSTYPSIKTSDIENLEINLPPIPVQNMIVGILFSLDDKIENNNSIIANLEEQAQAIFKSWFVDFEPFQDGEFVESDLGDIPKGWSIESLGDIVNIYDSERKPLSQMVRQGMERNYPYYGANGVIDYVEDYLFDGKYLLLGEDGTVQTNEGYPILNYIEEKFWVSNHAHIMTGDKISTEFLYVSIKRRNIRDIITGAVQQKINQRNLKSIKLVIPESNILINFQNIIEPIFEKVLVLKKSNKKLEETRDILLPKLMSGEIRVEEAIEVEEM